MQASGDDGGGEIALDDASTRICNPVQQRTANSQIPEERETPSSGLLVCDEGANLTFVVDQLPKKCELIGDAWPVGDAGTPVPCNYDCASGWCDPVTNDCLLVSECTTDGDCSDGSVCLCSVTNGWGFNKCVAADCRRSDDCGAFACAVVLTHPPPCNQLLLRIARGSADRKGGGSQNTRRFATRTHQHRPQQAACSRLSSLARALGRAECHASRVACEADTLRGSAIALLRAAHEVGRDCYRSGCRPARAWACEAPPRARVFRRRTATTQALVLARAW
jgi:hypothetical protein